MLENASNFTGIPQRPRDRGWGRRRISTACPAPGRRRRRPPKAPQHYLLFSFRKVVPTFPTLSFSTLSFSTLSFSLIFSSPPRLKRKGRAARSRFRPSKIRRVLKHPSALKQGPIFVGAGFFFIKAQKCGNPAVKRRKVVCRVLVQKALKCGEPRRKAREWPFPCTFGAVLSEIGPESTSMVFTQKSHSERFVCQKSEFLLLSRPSAPKGCDLCILSRGTHFLSARTLKTSKILDPDSGPISTRFCKSAGGDLVSGSGSSGSGGDLVSGLRPSYDQKMLPPDQGKRYVYRRSR